MRVLLFGGTFDPPHKGHLNNLRAAADAVHPNHIIVMPAGIPPHKAASATPGIIRLELCQCFRGAVPGVPVEVSDWEICREGRSYTVDTLAMLKQRFAGAHLYLSMGSDMLESFTQWREWQRIARMATLVVQSRESGDLPAMRCAAAALRRQGVRIVFAHAPVFPCASHEIRSGSLSAARLCEVLPEEVRGLIKKYNLYYINK